MNPANKECSTPDPDLLQVFVKGEREAAHRAFHQLVTRYERLVLAVCRRQLSNRCDIEDAFQTTFMLLATRAGKIRKPEALANWLYGVAWKTASRLRKRRQPAPYDDDQQLTSGAESPFDEIARRFQLETVDRSLGLLDEKYRIPLVLYFFSGMTTPQIAGRLGISVSAAEGRLRRAKAKLRVDLAGQGMLFSPVMFTAAMSVDVASWTGISSPELIATTCERCFATIDGVSSAGPGLTDVATSLTGNLDTGTRLMIYKSAIAIAIATLMTAGGFMHVQALPGQKVADQIWLTSNQESAGDDDLTLTPQTDEDAQAPPHEAMHQHMKHMHQRIHQHARHLLHWFHGSDEHDAVPLHRAHPDQDAAAASVDHSVREHLHRIEKIHRDIRSAAGHDDDSPHDPGGRPHEHHGTGDYDDPPGSGDHD